MNLHYQYYWFKEVIPHDVCDKIIKMGNEQIELVKKEGGDASGTTRGGGEKIRDDKRISAHKNADKYGFDYEIIKIPERRIQLWKWIFFINIQQNNEMNMENNYQLCIYL